MPRLPRADFSHTYHHVVVRGVDGLPIFDSETKKLRYIELMQEARETHDISIYAIGFVNNHVHHFVRRNVQEMGNFYRRVNGPYGSWYNRNFDRTGTLYDGRYFSVLVDSDSYFHAVWRYVHHQAVKAGVIDTVEKDKWSSAGLYLGRPSLFSWIDWEEATLELGVNATKDLRKILNQAGEEQSWYQQDSIPAKTFRRQRFLAGEEFIEKFMQIRRTPVRKNKRKQTPVPWPKIVAAAEEISGLPKTQLLMRSKYPDLVRHRRGMAYAGRKYGHLGISQIAEHLNVQPPAISRMIAAVLDGDPDLAMCWDDHMNV